MNSIPAPPLVAPPSPSSRSSPPQTCRYRNARESELEQLRQRGLAKLLNKHFTSVTQSIAEERAAADAALRDLEERRRNSSTKEWNTNHTDTELSYYDKLYLELQQKKAECKRKEKETLLLYQRYVAKFGGDVAGVIDMQHHQAASTSNAQLPGAPHDNHNPATTTPMTSSRGVVPLLASQIEDNITKHVMTGAERHPSIQSLGVEQTYQQVFEEMDEKQRIDYLRMLEHKGVDAKAAVSTTPVVSERKQTIEMTGARVGFPDSMMMTPSYWKSSPMFGGGGKWTNTTDTPVSQLTATTAGTGSPATNYDYNIEDEDDDDIKSSISELTSVHSLIMTDAEHRLTQFLKTETEAIKLMLDEEEATIGGTSTVRTSYSSEVGSTSARAADQAEDMVYQMQQILANFQQEQAETAAVVESREPRPYETNNPNEEWTVYFDETYQREYYHERHSNRTQWTPPPVKNDDDVRVADYTSPRSARNAAPLSHLEVMPEQKNLFGNVVRVSRREEYRRLRRKRRRQRRFVLALLSLFLVGAGYYVSQYHSDAVQQYTAVGMQSVESGLAYVWDKDKAASFVAKIKSYLPDSVVTGHQAAIKTTKELNKTKELQRKQAAKEAKKAKEEAERKAREEADQKALEEAERIAKEIVKAKEDAERKEAEKAAADRKARWDNTLKAMLEVMLQAPRPV